MSEDITQRIMDALGIELGDACKTCGGIGRRVYGSGSTWRGGVSGQVITSDVCDKWWGTGSRSRSGANLRRIEGVLADVKQQAEKAIRERDEAIAEAERLRAELATALRQNLGPR